MALDELVATRQLSEAVSLRFKKHPLNTQATAKERDAVVGAFHSGRLAEAEKMAKVLTQRHPRDAFGWKALGAVLHKSVRSLQALTPMRRAVELAPHDAAAHNNLSTALTKLERWDEAQTYCRRAIQLSPNFAEAHNTLGTILKGMKQHQEAQQCYRTAIRLKPHLWEAHCNLHDICAEQSFAQGDLLQAVEHLRCLLSLQLDQPLPAPMPTVVKKEVNRTEIEKLMWQTLAQLAAAGVHAFPIGGTLLGLVRDGHLLPFDKDVDFALPFNEMAQARACLSAQGWVEDQQAFRLINPVGFKHRETGLWLDLFACVHDVERHVFISGIWQQAQPWSMQRVTEFPAPLTLHAVAQAHGVVWMLQDPIGSWLLPVYGEGWHIPDPDFDTVVAAHNLRGFSPLTQLYGFMKINKHLQQGQLRKAQAITSHCLRHLPADDLLQRTAMILSAALSPSLHTPTKAIA